MEKKLYFLAVLLCIAGALFPTRGQVFDRNALATDIDTMMFGHYLEKYYPKVIDSQYGGILCGFDRRFNDSGTTDKPLNIEARHLWAAAMGALLHPEYAGYRQAADAAFHWMRDKMWDTAQGGSAFHAGTNRAGTALSTVGQYGPPDNSGLVCDKPTYHEGFALTGLAAYIMATGDSTALSMAKATFTWVDRKAHDSRYGWYYGWLDATGRVLDSTKDINYGMHWMEGMAWLSLVWPDSTLKSRVKEMADLFMSSSWLQATHDFCYNQNRSYTACNSDSYGHDAELVYLVYTCYQMIGITPSPATLSSLEAVYAFVKTKSMPGVEFENQWWYDAELFAAYGCVGSLYDAGDTNLVYCRTHWNFIKAQYFDHTYGGWYYQPYDSAYPKGNEWLATYHAFKCMLFVRNWLHGSPYGWAAPPATGIIRVKPLSPALAGVRAGQARYIILPGNIEELRGVTELYDLNGHRVSLSRVRAGADHGRATGVYIAVMQ